MIFTETEVSTLLDILDALAAGTANPSQRATAGALAARFRRGDEPFVVPGSGDATDRRRGERTITRLGVTIAEVYAQRDRDLQAARTKLRPWLRRDAERGA